MLHDTLSDSRRPWAARCPAAGGICAPRVDAAAVDLHRASSSRRPRRIERQASASVAATEVSDAKLARGVPDSRRRTHSGAGAGAQVRVPQTLRSARGRRRGRGGRAHQAVGRRRTDGGRLAPDGVARRAIRTPFARAPSTAASRRISSGCWPNLRPARSRTRCKRCSACPAPRQRLESRLLRGVWIVAGADGSGRRPPHRCAARSARRRGSCNELRLHLLRRQQATRSSLPRPIRNASSAGRDLRHLPGYLKTVDVPSLSPFPLLAIYDMETMDLDLAAMEHGMRGRRCGNSQGDKRGARDHRGARRARQEFATRECRYVRRRAFRAAPRIPARRPCAGCCRARPS